MRFAATRKHVRLLALFSILLLGLLLVACASSNAPAPAGDSGAAQDVAQDQVDEEVSPMDEVEQADQAQAETQTEEEPPGELVDTQRVGNVGVGFVSIPADYIPFQDLDGGTDLQFSDATGTSVFTLNAFDMSSVPEDQRDIFDVRAAAENVWANIEADGAQDVQGAIVELAGVDAYQVYGSYEDGIYLVCWLVGAPDGTIHYLAVEGPEETIYDNVAMAEASYGFAS